MASQVRIEENAEVVGADGVHLGTVDHLDGDRIKLTKADRPQFAGIGGRHHWISLGLVAAVDGQTVRLSAKADVAFDLFEEAE